MDATFTLKLKLPDDADPELAARALSDFLDDVPFPGELAEALCVDGDDSPFDGFSVDVYEGCPALPIAQALESLEATGNAWLRRSDDGTVDLVPTGELRIELDPRPAEHSPLAPLITEGWVSFLLAALVRCEQYLDAIPMIGAGGRAEGREALLKLLRPTLTRAEELASGSLADATASVAAEVAAVAARSEG